MSFSALAWAGKCKPGSASRKLVLLALADRHNDEADGAYPSIAWLVEFTDLNRKTVINALSELEAGGFISDSGERKGDTRQIKLYRLHIESIPKTEQSQKRNSPNKCAEQSQKRDTDTVRTSSSTKASPSSRARATNAKVLHFRLPDDWKPARFADGTVAREIIDRRGQEWARAALESFRAWAANADDKNGAGRKLNWQAAWVKWVIEQDKRDGRTNSMAGTGKPGNRSSGVGLIDAIRESRANREAVPWDAGDTGGMQIVAGVG